MQWSNIIFYIRHLFEKDIETADFSAASTHVPFQKGVVDKLNLVNPLFKIDEIYVRPLSLLYQF